jgi:hypothetical protein
MVLTLPQRAAVKRRAFAPPADPGPVIYKPKFGKVPIMLDSATIHELTSIVGADNILTEKQDLINIIGPPRIG